MVQSALYGFAALRMSSNVISARNDKQSLHYMVRSGLAGGIAGCVVSFTLHGLAGYVVLIYGWTGKNGRRTFGQSQDTVPIVQS